MIALVLKMIRIAPHQRHSDFTQRNPSAAPLSVCAGCAFVGRRCGSSRNAAGVALLFASLQLGHVAGHAFVGGEKILGGLQHLRVVRRTGRTRRLAAKAECGFWLVFRVVAGGQQFGGAFAHFDLEVDFLLEVQLLGMGGGDDARIATVSCVCIRILFCYLNQFISINILFCYLNQSIRSKNN